jgi:hypothetical protein
MVWTHQLSCCESSILLSVFNSHLFPSTSSMPRPLAYRYPLPLSNRYYTVVLETCNDEVIFFMSVIPSDIRQFKFTVSWLCDDLTAAGTFVVVKGFRQRTMTAPSPLEGLQFSIVSCKLVDDSRMGTATGPRSR